MTKGAGDRTVPQSSTKPATKPLRCRGYYYDTETGFYYLQSRYYDPVIHRFINADSYASTDATDAISCNMFAYCGNNPVNFTDEQGDRAVFVTVAEDHTTYNGKFFKICVTVSLKALVASINDGIPCDVSIGNNEIEVTFEDHLVLYSFGIDDNKAFAGIGCVFDKTSYMLKGSFFSDELTCSIETEVNDGLLLEVDVTVTSDDRGMLDHAKIHASAVLSAAGTCLAYGLAYRGGGRPVYAMNK